MSKATPVNAGPITQRHGEEVQTTYSGNASNRLSYLREDTAFLHNSFTSPHARFLPFREFNPLLNSTATKLQWLELAAVKDTIGDPYVMDTADRALRWDPQRDASGARTAQVVFLGFDENVTESKVCTGKGVQITGAPRFAVDVTEYEQATFESKRALSRLIAIIKRIDENGKPPDFQSIIFGVNLNHADFSIVAEARIILDWINRVRFCGGCGRRNMVIWGGFKLSCPTSFTSETSCPTRGKITNSSFPRTDCCIIVAVLSHDGSKISLGRGRRFRGSMYSCLAGFLESGESIEDCVRREVFEESGVKVGRVIMHSSQPWPYPSNLMIGCLAEVADDKPESAQINLGHDEESLDAKWVPKEDSKSLCKGEGDFKFTLPPKMSIAWVLLNAAANDLY